MEDGGPEDGGRRTEDGGQRTEDRGQRTEDRGRGTEDRGRRTEDGGRRTEDGGRRTEDIRLRQGSGGQGRQRSEEQPMNSRAADFTDCTDIGALMSETV